MDWLIYITVYTLAWLFHRMPKRLAMAIGNGIGHLLHRLLKKRRRIALENLKIAFGNTLSDKERQKICQESFINLGKTTVEFLRFQQLTFENIWREVTVQGKEHLIQALNQGNGAIVWLPHFGNWELLALVYGALIPNRAKAIAFPLKNQRLNTLVSQYREHLSLALIPRKRAVRETLRALKANHAVGFFADQNAGREGVFVDFFEKPASAVRGPVTLALKTGAPIFFSLDVRQPDDRHFVYISKPLALEISGDFEQDVQTNTACLLRHLEDYIRQYPSQWLWIHNRWKTQPDSDWQMRRDKQLS